MAIVNTITLDEVCGVRLGKYNLADNSTSVIYRLGNTIIDSGPPNQWKEMLEYLTETGISKLLLSHHHEDHSGNGKRIANHFNVPVYVHEKGIESLEKGFPLRLYQKLIWGKPATFTPEPLPDIIKTGSGHTLISIYTPGHSPDHVCFLEPDKKWLFTGDLFLATRPKLFRADEDLDNEIKSLQTILTYDFKTLFCAHKGIVENGYMAIQNKLNYFLSLVDEVKRKHDEGCTIEEITIRIFGKKDLPGIISFGHISNENLVRACLKVS